MTTTTPGQVFQLSKEAAAEVAAAGRNRKPLIAYHFLRWCVQRDQAFTLAELAAATGWRGQTPGTYANKQWEQLLEKTGQDGYIVKPEFARLSPSQFMRRFTQKRPVYSEYDRRLHGEAVMYEFLLPLTREAQLRDALDELFYRDAVEQRPREIGLASLARIMTRGAGEDDAAFTRRIVDEVGTRFGGYSITHVNGRFRAGPIATRNKAGDLLATRERYLIDETTASVRFIVPCSTQIESFSGDYDSICSAVLAAGTAAPAEIISEVSEIRGLFFSFFVEAVVKTVLGEDEIWLIETTSRGARLFVWARKAAV